jgi:hypothetical protein
LPGLESELIDYNPRCRQQVILSVGCAPLNGVKKIKYISEQQEKYKFAKDQEVLSQSRG